jgi:phosphatidylinositol glycan class W
VNLPYILWITAFNTSFFLGYLLLLDIWFYPRPDPTPSNTNLKKKEDERDSTRTRREEEVEKDDTPTLFTAINRHGLLIFLIVRPPPTPSEKGNGIIDFVI